MPRAASTSSVRREHARSGRVQRSTANPRCPPQCSVRPTRKPRYVTIATRRSDAGGQKTQQQRKAQVTSGKSRFARLPFIMIDLIVGVMAEPHVAGGKGPPWRADDLDGGSTAMRLRRRASTIRTASVAGGCTITTVPERGSPKGFGAFCFRRLARRETS